MRRLSLFGAWLLVLVLTTTLAWQIVSAADDRVSDRPNTALNVAAPSLDPDPTTSTLASDATTTIPEPVSTSAVSTSTTVPSSTSSTSTTVGSAPPTDPTPPDTTTTTTPDTTTTTVSAWSARTIPTSGGTVVVKYRPGEVVLQTATPAAGFQAEVEDAGPPEVEVDFESESTKVEVNAEWKDGELDIEVEESDDS